MATRKTCWTCTSRKVRCDGALPSCNVCRRTGRDCQGYGLRLSWPRKGDKKRAILQSITTSAATGRLGRVPSGRFLINTSTRDLQTYHGLSRGTQAVGPSWSARFLTVQSQSLVDYQDLVHYFYHSAHQSLATFDDSTSGLRDVIMGLTVAQGVDTDSALFFALLAFSSLRRHGQNQQAMRFKILALRRLTSLMDERPGAKCCLLQGVAASMLLASFDTLLPSQNSGEWLHYVRGAMGMVQAAGLDHRQNESSAKHLVNWACYYDTMSRFSMRHWRDKPSAAMDSGQYASKLMDAKDTGPSIYRPTPPPPDPSHAILSLLSQVCNTLLDPKDPMSKDQQYQARLDSLKSSLSTVVKSDDPPVMVGLYQVSTLIYLVRASQGHGEPEMSLASLIDATFAGLVGACSLCKHSFPLLILASEARKDEHRMILLNLIDRAGRDAWKSGVAFVKNVIQTIWVQQDLSADDDLLTSYVGILNTAIGCYGSVPAFI